MLPGGAVVLGQHCHPWPRFSSNRTPQAASADVLAPLDNGPGSTVGNTAPTTSGHTEWAPLVVLLALQGTLPGPVQLSTESCMKLSFTTYWTLVWQKQKELNN